MARIAPYLIAALCAVMYVVHASAQSVWRPDTGDGRYRNPILHADYSDPDVIRTGDDYWLTASSFNCVPGLQILHSTDLVNWEIVNAALETLPWEDFDSPSHGNGVWAPSIRFHDGMYHIYWGDPDRGIFVVSAPDPRGKWSSPHLVKEGKGMIDPCPLWDDDGRAYLVHGWAGSRAGFKSVLSVTEMSPDGRKTIGGEVLVFDGHDDNPTVEGPKFYKRNGWYYIFAPAGGVKTGWQIVLRSRSVYGPYECRRVMHQGATSTPGPHQGAWVEDVEGESWFIHFVDMYAYGRVVHLQPVVWHDDWCVIGRDPDGDGMGEPVESWRKPASHVAGGVKVPASDDEFSSPRLGLQWQWPANPRVGQYFTDPSDGTLRLYCRVGPEERCNLSDNGSLLLQKIDAPTYTATARLHFRPSYEGDRAGLVVMGHDYAGIGLRLSEGRVVVERLECPQAIRQHTPETSEAVEVLDGGAADIYLRCRVELRRGGDGIPRMYCRFSYSLDGRRFREAGGGFEASAGYWIGAKIGFYTDARVSRNDGGWVDIDWFRTSE